MEEITESCQKSKKTKYNLLRKLCCCFYKPDHHKNDNEKTNVTLKVKKPKSKFWRRLRNRLSKSAEPGTEVFDKFDIYENDEQQNNPLSIISVDDDETPKIKGNVTVHKTSIYNNTENSENKNENIPCLNSLDTDSEEKDVKNLPHQNNTTDSITTPTASTSLASISFENIPLAESKCEIPKFYFPSGKKNAEQWNAIEHKISTFFQTLPNAQASKNHFDDITKLCGLPFYLRNPLFFACVGKEHRTVKLSDFIKYWKVVWSNCSDMSAIFVRVMSKNTNINVLTRDDFKILIQDVIDTHPGLSHLKSAPKFHSGYAQTVIASMFYDVNTSWSGKMNVMEIRRSKLIAVINSLENENTFKQLPSYFNYEQYIVIDNIFWRLDRNKCSTITIHDLNRYYGYALSEKILKRIFSGTVIKRGEHDEYDKTYMDYWDFVFFIRSEEDKTHSRAIEYWFRCMDIDGDGYLSLFELEYFYDEQLERLKDMGLEGRLPPFKERISEILYMVKPKYSNKISLTDLKSSKMSNLFFNTFFNIDKYLKHTERDPHESFRERKNANDKSDWDIFVEEEY